MRVLFTIQYLGTRYAGWQTQANALAVQQVLEEALAQMVGAPVRTEGASRTDAGVHAAAQKAHADIDLPIPPLGLMRGLNDLLPSDIRVMAAEQVDDAFHCRFHAKRKLYVYRIWNEEVADVFRAATHAHVRQPLDHEAMDRAGRALVGRHDFRSFTVSAPEVSSTVRTVDVVGVQRQGSLVEIELAADGFLRYMVRRIAGSLIEIGRGAEDEGLIVAALEPGFAPARWTAPAGGLTLQAVEYPRPAPAEAR
jgi:tRNA pseudouridine38-40 synthase